MSDYVISSIEFFYFNWLFNKIESPNSDYIAEIGISILTNEKMNKYIAMIAYTQISTDARVIRAAKAAVEADFSIDFYTLNGDSSFSIDGVNIIRSKQYQIRAGFIKYIISIKILYK